MKKGIIVVWTFILITLLNISTFPQEVKIYKVFGTITNNKNNEPVRDANISFSELPFCTSTDYDGSFYLYIENTTRVTLNITKDKYDPELIDVPLPLSGPLNVSITPIFDGNPEISIATIKKNDYVTGTVSGVNPDTYDQFKVILYARTDKWYIHPTSDSFARIDENGEWKIRSVERYPFPTQIAAFLVKAEFEAPKAINRTAVIETITEIVMNYY